MGSENAIGRLKSNQDEERQIWVAPEAPFLSLSVTLQATGSAPELVKKRKKEKATM